MKEYISYCGLNCETCNARLATIFNDDALREAAGYREQKHPTVIPYVQSVSAL